VHDGRDVRGSESYIAQVLWDIEIGQKTPYGDHRASGGLHDGKALSRLAEAALLAPLDADVLATQGALLARAGRDTEAEEAFHRALAVEPGHATARYDLGCLYLRRREGLLAEVQFRIACQAMPDDPLARLGWAMALRLEGRDEEAATQLTRSLALSPPGGAVSLARSELLALSSGAEEPMSLPPGSSGE